MSVITEYRDLLVEYLPQPIRSDREHHSALAKLERLMVDRPSTARSRLIEMLSTLIEDYESREHPTPGVPPAQMLAHLLSVRGIKCADVARQARISPATLSSVLANRRGISKANAQKLAHFFRVSPVLFLDGMKDTCDAG